MTREEAAKILKRWLRNGADGMTDERLGYIEGWFHQEDREAFETAIKALEAQEHEEWTRKTITIADILDSVYDEYTVLPSAQSEIVRCKDCRWGREVCGNIECFVDKNIPPEYHGYEWFCPNGESK